MLRNAFFPAPVFCILLGCAAHPDEQKPKGAEKSQLTLSLALGTAPRPFLTDEIVDGVELDLTLSNTGSATATVTDFEVAHTRGDLVLEVLDPKKETTGPMGVHLPFKDVRDWHFDIRKGDKATSRLTLNYFTSHSPFPKAGEYELILSLRPRPKAEWLRSAPVRVKVLDAARVEVLASTEGGAKFNRPNADIVPFIQQLAIDGKVYLYYRVVRRENGKFEAPERSHFLAVLPKKVDLTVEGKYGDLSPITITYRTQADQKETKLIVNSIDPRPWTVEEERLRLEAEKKEREKAKDKK